MTILQKALVTATIAVATGVGIYEAWQVSSLRSEVDALRQQQASSANQIQQLERVRDDALSRLAHLTDENAALKDDSTKLANLRDELSRLKAAVSATKNPQGNEAVRAQPQPVLEKTYASLFKNLKLPAEQQEALKELLLARKKALEDAQLTVFGGSNSDLKQTIEDAKTIKADYAKKIQDLLGTQAYPMFQQYDETLSERIQVQSFEGALPSAGALTDQQEEKLIAAMHEERKSLPASSLLNNESPDPSQFTEDSIADTVKQLEQLQERFADRAASILTPEQLEQFAKFMQQWSTMQAAGMKMFVQMYGNKGAPQTPTASQGQMP